MSNLGNKETMAKNLHYYLERSGRTQKEIAEIVGASTSAVNDWMKGKAYPRIDKLEMLANFFGILKSDLIEEKSEEHREMHKKNDTITDVIVRMRSDEEFLTVVGGLLTLNAEQMSAVKQLLLVLQK